MPAVGAIRLDRVRTGTVYMGTVYMGTVPGPDHPPRTDLAGPGDHRRDRDRLAAFHRLGDLAQLGETGLIDRLDEDVDNPAAGQPDRERVVVAHPVCLQDRIGGLADVQR